MNFYLVDGNEKIIDGFSCFNPNVPDTISYVGAINNNNQYLIATNETIQNSSIVLDILKCCQDNGFNYNDVLQWVVK